MNHRLNGRMRRLETGMELAKPSKETLLVFHLPEETHKAALERFNIDSSAWAHIRFRKWQWLEPRPCPCPRPLALVWTMSLSEFTAGVEAKRAEIEAARRQRQLEPGAAET